MKKHKKYWWLPLLLIVCSALANAQKNAEKTRIQVLRAAEVKVVDGDSLYLGKKEIRLSGIDAPEYHQTCFDARGHEYACGKKSFEVLKSLAGSDIRCKTVAKDKYKRYVSVCESGGVDINKKMVENGWAVAYKRYTHDYDEAEMLAKRQKRGIWQGRFMKPELYRILNKSK